jgi:hypothetical protein
MPSLSKRLSLFRQILAFHSTTTKNFFPQFEHVVRRAALPSGSVVLRVVSSRVSRQRGHRGR